VSQKDLTSANIKRPGILCQDPEPFKRKWMTLADEKDVGMIFEKAKTDFMWCMIDLRDEAASKEFTRAIASYQEASVNLIKSKHAARFTKIANEEKLRL
jgi:hypothetical protein